MKHLILAFAVPSTLGGKDKNRGRTTNPCLRASTFWVCAVAGRMVHRNYLLGALRRYRLILPALVFLCLPASAVAQQSWTVTGAEGELLDEYNASFQRSDKGIELKAGRSASWLRYNMSGLFARLPYFCGFRFQLEFVDGGEKTSVEAFLIEHDPRSGQDRLIYRLNTNQFSSSDGLQTRARQLCNLPWQPDPTKYYFALARLADSAAHSDVRPRLESITISTIDC